MTDTDYVGLLVIGDPHLEGRPPGFRKDDYPTVILDKLAWCLEYARNNRLLPAILGDLFDKPRDNPNWVLVRLMELLQGEVLALYGNHDVHYNPELTENDSLCLLVRAGRLRLLDCNNPWRGHMAGREVIIGGSCYRQPIPDCFAPDPPCAAGAMALTIWLAHHDILIPGYEKGYLKPREIEGIDLLVNGHIHRRLADVAAGKTMWVTPGNISRRSRSDATRDHKPSALRIDVTPTSYTLNYIELPHRPFDEVFHEAVIETAERGSDSAFVAGLAELQARRTAGGAGLMEFLSQNVRQFEPAVADEIMNLAKEVTDHAAEEA